MTLRKSLLEFVDLPDHEVIPVSGEGGFNIWKGSGLTTWNPGRTLVEHLNNLKVPEMYYKNLQSAKEFCFTIMTGGKNSVIGKVESGAFQDLSRELVVMPSLLKVKALSIWRYDKMIDSVNTNDIVEIKLYEEHCIKPGSVLVNHESNLSRGPYSNKFVGLMEVKYEGIMNNCHYELYLNVQKCKVLVRDLCFDDGEGGLKPTISASAGDTVRATFHCYEKILFAAEHLDPRMATFALKLPEGGVLAFGDIIGIDDMNLQ